MAPNERKAKGFFWFIKSLWSPQEVKVFANRQKFLWGGDECGLIGWLSIIVPTSYAQFRIASQKSRRAYLLWFILGFTFEKSCGLSFCLTTITRVNVWILYFGFVFSGFTIFLIIYLNFLSAFCQLCWLLVVTRTKQIVEFTSSIRNKLLELWAF